MCGESLRLGRWLVEPWVRPFHPGCQDPGQLLVSGSPQQKPGVRRTSRHLGMRGVPATFESTTLKGPRGRRPPRALGAMESSSLADPERALRHREALPRRASASRLLLTRRAVLRRIEVGIDHHPIARDFDDLYGLLGAADRRHRDIPSLGFRVVEVAALDGRPHHAGLRRRTYMEASGVHLMTTEELVGARRSEARGHRYRVRGCQRPSVNGNGPARHVTRRLPEWLPMTTGVDDLERLFVDHLVRGLHRTPRDSSSAS